MHKLTAHRGTYTARVDQFQPNLFLFPAGLKAQLFALRNFGFITSMEIAFSLFYLGAKASLATVGSGRRAIEGPPS